MSPHAEVAVGAPAARVRTGRRSRSSRMSPDGSPGWNRRHAPYCPPRALRVIFCRSNATDARRSPAVIASRSVAPDTATRICPHARAARTGSPLVVSSMICSPRAMARARLRSFRRSSSASYSSMSSAIAVASSADLATSRPAATSNVAVQSTPARVPSHARNGMRADVSHSVSRDSTRSTRTCRSTHTPACMAWTTVVGAYGACDGSEGTSTSTDARSCPR